MSEAQTPSAVVTVVRVHGNHSIPDADVVRFAGLGERGRLSVPLTLGGTRQAALEIERRFDAGPIHTVRGGVSASRLENPHYRVDDRRLSVRLGAERQIVDALRISTDVRWSDIRFGSIFWSAAFLTLQLDAAHDLRGGMRLHLGTGVSF